jgi:hypothetical protein
LSKKETGEQLNTLSADTGMSWKRSMITGIHDPAIRLRCFVACSSWRFFLFVPMLALVFPGDSCASQAIPGEAQAGLFYTITHLHPAAYFILFLILLLSVANLIFQFGLTGLLRPVWFLVSLVRGLSEDHGGPPVLRGLTRARFGNPAVRGNNEPTSGIGKSDNRDVPVILVRKMEKSDEAPSMPHAPTPLEGVNHPLPKLSSASSQRSGAPRVMGSDREQKASASEFKFSSAVDVPSQEEIERREKSQLIVAGSVTGVDGKAIPSVIVYLTNEEGDRVGQSCRSKPETGEFKVLINEPGTYRINGYKRGYVMDQNEPMALPIESGKIEGLNFHMIPEGCIVTGSLVMDDDEKGVSDHEVTCVCRSENYSRSVKTDDNGRFQINGLPVNSQCILEVRAPDGNLLTRTDAFQTVQKREVRKKIRIDSVAPVSQLEPEQPASAGLESEPSPEEEGGTPEQASEQPHTSKLPPGNGSSAPAAP